MGNGLPAFVDEVPEYSCKDGRIYICLGGGMCLAMPINIFLKGCARGTRAIKEWQRGERGEVIPFPCRSDVSAKLGAS